MNSAPTNEYIFDNLKTVSEISAETRLCVCEPLHKIFVVKKAPLDSLPVWEAMRETDNPHIAKVLYIRAFDSYAEIVCEYIAGDTLAERLRDGALPRDSAIKIVSNVCDGLSACHARGLIHRDINPNNIILSRDGGATVIDFGIARAYDSDKTTDTVILGTPGYAAPEQFGFSQSDARTDIYAVGVLLNVLLTGRLPNETVADGTLGKIVKKCVAIDSEKRYKSIDELKNAVTKMMPSYGAADRFINRVPGLNSKHPAVVVLSIIGYFFMILLSATIFSQAGHNFQSYILTAVGWLMAFVLPFILFNNYFDIWNRLPFTRNSSVRSQKIIFITIGVIAMFFGLVLLGNSDLK